VKHSPPKFSLRIIGAATHPGENPMRIVLSVSGADEVLGLDKDGRKANLDFEGKSKHIPDVLALLREDLREDLDDPE
jgi:hypothetical protein